MEQWGHASTPIYTRVLTPPPLLGKIVNGGHMATSVPTTSFGHRHPADRQFVAVLVTLIWVAILTGFGIDMVAKAAAHRLDYPLVVHLHAITYGGWLVLLTAQVWLIRTNRVSVHRRLGMALWVLLPLMVILGPATAFAVKAAKPVLTDQALGFTAVQLGNVLGAGVLLTAGYFWRRDAATHKRLMLMGAVALTEPGFSRIWRSGISAMLGSPETVFSYWTSIYIGTFGLMLPMGAWDLVTRKRLHPAWIAAFTWIVAVQSTASWLNFQPFWIEAVRHALGR